MGLFRSAGERETHSLFLGGSIGLDAVGAADDPSLVVDWGTGTEGVLRVVGDGNTAADGDNTVAFARTGGVVAVCVDEDERTCGLV